MAELHPLMPSTDGTAVSVTVQPQDAPEPVPITDQEVGEYREQDRHLPIANVARIMKASVPSSAKIAKDAKETVQECVSEFISFITSEAAERCQLEKRKTIGGEDILHAMIALGFDNYAETLKIHLAKLRQGGPSNIAQRDQQQPAPLQPRLDDESQLSPDTPIAETMDFPNFQ
ncbi:hypothetical protein EST38_g7174 [Candolleomyces aberdarensis]|uniref:Transcription factor CBF/NF-Y/archaeal histone domain-containing protein n=1 Tax=Candolleomyces aberdarensis TaxID=2316362 RepID=A0A4Q2DG98_9AGAR|nr:hypothetical protein EST38_g7174 [Candolleomyces aberdarensis]